jgi:hypothetical protein
MPDISNEELIELAKQQELEGGETTQVVQAVADRFGQISTELATAQALAVSDDRPRGAQDLTRQREGAVGQRAGRAHRAARAGGLSSSSPGTPGLVALRFAPAFQYPLLPYAPCRTA